MLSESGPRMRFMPRALSQEARAIDEGATNLGIVDGIEKTEEAGLVFVAVEVRAVDLCGDAPRSAPVAKRHEASPVGVPEERVFLAQPVFQLEIERPYVHRVVAIDPIDDVEERAKIAPNGYFANVGRHG